MKRYLKEHVLEDLEDKIVLISGPRQTGKTVLSKQLCDDFDYLNYDASADRLIIRKQTWDRDRRLVIFDELHKMKNWKRWLKGLYDTQGNRPALLVTGSAKMDVHRRVGDSLAGRYFQYRLHPVDVKEAVAQLQMEPVEAFELLWKCSGFPEPFLKGSEVYYKRWRRTHIDIILRQDLIDLSSVRDIESVQTLVLLLAERAGSTVSYANLARDLERDAKTVKRWLQLLENLYVIHRVTPYSRNIARSLKKEPKYYFYDHTLVSSPGARLENLLANALKKELHYREDTRGVRGALHYLRNKEGAEVDFLICQDDKPVQMIEVKMGDEEPSNALKHFGTMLPDCQCLQLVKQLKRDKSYADGRRVKALIPWLCHLPVP